MVLSFFKHVAAYFLPDDPQANERVNKAKELGIQKVRTFLSRSNSSLTDICVLIECAENRNELQIFFGRLDRIMRILSLAAPLGEHKGIIVEALEELKFSDKFRLHLNTAATAQEAVMTYKTAVVEELAVNNRKMDILSRRDQSFNEDLLASFFPRSAEHQSEVKGTADDQSREHCESCYRKRGFAEITQSEGMEVQPTIGSGNTQPTD